VFLDEIGDMPMAAQAKVLRLLQDQTFERVGGAETIQTHIRVIAATNQDLGRRIAAGQFRADLFYRLQGVTIELPPLRDRPDDIAELAHHFLFFFNRELGLNIQGFDPEALAALRAYRWPGNVRELQAALKETMLRATGALLLPEFLPAAVRQQPDVRSAAQLPEDADIPKLIDDLVASGQNNIHGRVVAAVERMLFERVLHATGGHLGRSAERLGLNRSTLRYKLRDAGLSADRPPTE
jgi:DNA-binding NtrC family response regulator